MTHIAGSGLTPITSSLLGTGPERKPPALPAEGASLGLMCECCSISADLLNVPLLGESVCPGVSVLVRCSLGVTCRSALFRLNGHGQG